MNGCELIALPSVEVELEGVEVELGGVSRWPPRGNLSTSGLLSTIDARPYWKIHDENTIQFLYQEQNYHFCTPRLQVQLAGPSSSPYGQEAAAHRGYHITNGNGNSNERTDQPWLAVEIMEVDRPPHPMTSCAQGPVGQSAVYAVTVHGLTSPPS